MILFLGLICIAVILVIFFQISKASEYITELKGEERINEETDKVNANLFMIFLVLGTIGVIWSAFHYAPLFLPEPSSEHGVWIRNMFFWTLVATVPVFLITHVLLFFFSWKYKNEKGRKAFHFAHSNKLEAIWTLIPAVVMVLLVYEGMKNWYKITGPAPTESLVIEATGQQFSWNIRYAGKDNKLGKKSVRAISTSEPVNPMGQIWTDEANKDDFMAGGDNFHLPVGVPILVKISSLDVLHSFYLPHFRVKMDAVPGIPTQFWFTATKTTEDMRAELGDPEFNYELACAELCGKSHFNMKKLLIVEPKEDFDKWFAEQKSVYEIFGAGAPSQDTTPSAVKNETEKHNDTDAGHTSIEETETELSKDGLTSAL